MPKLHIGNLVAQVPVVQGGMGVGISLSRLAAAVANQGGIGVIATAGIGLFERNRDIDPKSANVLALRREIKQARDASPKGIIGVNIMVALSDFNDLVQCAVDEGIDILMLGAGLPTRLPDTLPLDRLGDLSTKFAPIVSSDRAARIIFRSWAKQYKHVPDAVVVEGPLAGGHLGFKKDNLHSPDFALENIVPGVIDVVREFEERFNKKIPVIVGGGVFTGHDIKKFLDLGAQGVQMGTRFVTTTECDASDEFKQAHLSCTKEDIVIIDSPVGLPGRAIKNKFLEKREQGIRESFTCPWKCLRSCEFKKVHYCIAKALINAQCGDLEHGFAFAGANAYRTDKLLSVEELMNALIKEYDEACS
jgi:nitronate monooxygenase